MRAPGGGRRPGPARRRAPRTSARTPGCSAPRCSRTRPSRRAHASEMAGRLVVCPTPIGNLEDVTLRVLGALRDADVVACEDTRHTRVLLDRHGIRARALV